MIPAEGSIFTSVTPNTWRHDTTTSQGIRTPNKNPKQPPLESKAGTQILELETEMSTHRNRDKYFGTERDRPDSIGGENSRNQNTSKIETKMLLAITSNQNSTKWKADLLHLRRLTGSSNPFIWSSLLCQSCSFTMTGLKKKYIYFKPKSVSVLQNESSAVS